MGKKMRFQWQWLLIVVAALGLGLIVGTRYLGQSEAAQVYLGTLLPPRAENWKDSQVKQLTPGMEKEKVADILRVRRCNILCGSSLEEFISPMKGRDDEHGISTEDAAEISEVWLIPRRRAGVSDFLLLAFDGSNHLYLMKILEFSLGFKATR